MKKNVSNIVSSIPFIMHGTQYYRAPTPPPNEWPKDIKNIKNMGFTTIKILVQWRWHERIRGSFYWDDLDEIFTLCEKSGLWVILNFALDSAPEWLYNLYDCRRIDNRGNPIPIGADGCRYVGGWEPCLDSNEVQEEASRFIKAIVERYKNKKSLLVWDIWNEPRSRPIGDCACEASNEKYRQWLQEKFKTVENFNQTFGKAWGRWEEVHPPALTRDYAEIYLWRLWRMYNLALNLKWLYKVVKEVDPKHFSMAHVGGCSVLQDILHDSSDDCLNRKEVDFYGSSLPCGGEEPPWYASLNNDWIRSVSKYYWISEIYTGSSGWQNKITATDLNFWAWTSFASGAKGVCYWQYKTERLGNESNGYGLVRLDGSDTDYVEKVIKTNKVLQKYNDILTKATPEVPSIALVYDHRSDLISRIEEPTDLECTYKKAAQGTYALFWRNNISVDWISIHNIERIIKYKMVYYPVPFVMDQRTAEILKSYVKKGGFLVSEASMGLRNENTWLSTVVPGCGLVTLFGCKEKRRLAVSEPLLLTIPTYNLELPLTNIVSYLEPTSAKVLGFWKGQEPAVTVHEYGKGKAMFLGMYPGLSYLNTKARKMVEFVRLIVDEAGIETPVCLKGAKGIVAAKLMKNGQKRLLFLFNYENCLQKIQIVRPVLVNPIDLLSKFEGTSDNSNILSIPPHEVSCILSESLS